VGTGAWRQALESEITTIGQTPTPTGPRADNDDVADHPRPQMTVRGSHRGTVIDGKPGLEADTSAARATTGALTAIVVDHCWNDAANERCLSRVRDLVTQRVTTAQGTWIARAAVIVSVDGRQTEPIPLSPAPPAKGSESRLWQALLAASRGSKGAVLADPAHAVLLQMRDLASSVTFAVEALDPDAIVVVTDASSRLAGQDPPESLAGMPSPAQFLARLREEDCAPQLDRRAVSVVAPRQTWPSFHSYWAVVCATSENYERIEVDAAVTPASPTAQARGRLEVAKAWVHVIGRTAYLPMTADEMTEFLLKQVNILADTVNAELFDPSPAVDVGRALVNNDFTGPESLQCSVEILARALLRDSERSGDRDLAERVVGLLSAMATGYATAMRLHALDQQEHIKRALLKSMREAQRREQAATERFEEVFHGSAIGMALTDMSGTFVQTNRALAGILECEPADLSERNIRELFPAEDADDMVLSYREVTDGIVQGVRERRRMLRQDGTCAWVYLVISLLKDSSGVPAYHITMIENLSELQALQNQLDQQSVRDMLTGVANRQHFQSKLDAVLEAAGPHTSITLLHVGIDSFSVINSGLGHVAGDRMLQVVANRLCATMEPYDALIGRVGGDEFAVLIENTQDTPHYSTMIDDINSALSEPTFVGDVGVAVCVSIGVAEHQGRVYGRLDLLRAANSTMRRAKAVGMRQWEAHSIHEDADEKARFALTAAMLGAWEMGELSLEYQPVVDLADGRLAALEVMLRWDHPTEGVISHDPCWDMAESTGMSLPIGPWVLFRACGELSDRTSDDVRLRLRLTQLQSCDGDLAAVVNRAVARHGIAPDRLEISLDARAVAANRGESQSNLQVLRDNGVLVGMHEFTGGTTEFAIVAKEQIKSVILAGSIVAAQHKPVLTKVTTAMIGTLRELGAAVSVVDVPTAQKAAWWHAAGASYAQGVFTGAPVLSESLHRLTGRGTGSRLLDDVVAE
jgi:diguanylate cyclase (GGDEF)-like protein/PAS domain S-box-containing protein